MMMITMMMLMAMAMAMAYAECRTFHKFSMAVNLHGQLEDLLPCELGRLIFITASLCA